MMLLAGRHWLQAGRKYPLLIGLWPSMAWDYRMDMLNLVYDSCARSNSNQEERSVCPLTMNDCDSN